MIGFKAVNQGWGSLAFPKQKTGRSREYMAFVRTLRSIASGSENEIIAHHVRCMGGGGMGMKPSDYFCVPLTNEEHQKLHNTGEPSFWTANDSSPEEAVLSTQLLYLARLPAEKRRRAVFLIDQLLIALNDDCETSAEEN